MSVPYSIVTSIALLIAFLIAGALARFTGFRAIVFGVAGATALFALFTILRSVLGTVGIFGARGPTGLAAQMVVGAVAGVLFAQLTRPHHVPEGRRMRARTAGSGRQSRLDALASRIALNSEVARHSGQRREFASSSPIR
jgi:hypothetical protein